MKLDISLEGSSPNCGLVGSMARDLQTRFALALRGADVVPLLRVAHGCGLGLQ